MASSVSVIDLEDSSVLALVSSLAIHATVLKTIVSTKHPIKLYHRFEDDRINPFISRAAKKTNSGITMIPKKTSEAVRSKAKFLNLLKLIKSEKIVVPDIRLFLETIDHKEDLDSTTLKVISHINDKINNSENSTELNYEAVRCKSNLLQLRFGILRRSAGFLSIPPGNINSSPDTYSTAIFLENFKTLENDNFSFLLMGELYNVEIHDNLGNSFEVKSDVVKVF